MIFPDDDAAQLAGLTRAELWSALATLQKARVEGVRRIRYEGNGVSREVEYRSDQELAAAIKDVETRLAGRPRIQTVVIRPAKAWLP